MPQTERRESGGLDRRTGSPRSLPAPRTVFLTTLVGVLLMQLAWILSVPAFAGIDEFDHSYKAAAVAHGELGHGPISAHGRGFQVTVPASLVEAASRACAALPYTGHDNCHPVQSLGNGMVTVDSAASTYNPAYYAVVGLVARPFHGTSALMVMRAATAVISALLLAWAAAITARWARTTWPLVALVVAMTPMLIYSTAVNSPNGVGYSAGCLLWAAALGYVASRRAPRLAPLVTAAIVLVVTHSTGLMWLALIASAVAVLMPRQDWLARAHGWSARSVAALVAVGVTAVASVAWILVMKTNSPKLPGVASVANHHTVAPSRLALAQVLWGLQTIGAFPMRDQPAPLPVYALWLVPFGFVMVLGWRAASRRLRLSMTLVTVLWSLVPSVLTIMTFSLLGYAWQGRYALPLSVGLPALAGLALARAGREPARVLVTMLLSLCAVAQGISVASLAARTDLAGHTPAVLHGPVGVSIAFLLALAGGLTFLSAVRARAERPVAQPARLPAPVLVEGGVGRA